MKNFRLFSFLFLAAFLFTFTACESVYEDDGIFADTPLEDVFEGQADNTLDPDMGIAIYKVDGEFIIPVDQAKAKKSWMEDEEKHRAIWEMTTTLIPSDYRRWLASFEVFDGKNDLLGYVNPTEEDLSGWKFALDIRTAYPDGNTLEQSGDYIHTIIHEFGHVLALNDEQLKANKLVCSTYNPGEGCAKSDAYLLEFYNRYWADIANEIPEEDASDRELNNFYDKYEDRFVTDYAATNPVEDFAEVFATFITSDSRPEGNVIKDQKVQFLYEYPELVDLREHMRGTVYTLPKAGEWTRKKCNHAAH
ncbi:MAG: putative zinc-binding metallopeptidase [Saprospiraceae bacterium]